MVFRYLKQRLFVGNNVDVGARFHIGLGSFISAPNHLVIGADVYVGKYCSIQCNGRIGNGVLIANNVGIVGRRDHDFRSLGVWVRRAPWVGDSDYLAKDPKNAVAIGDDVWIGYGAVVLSGLDVGRGSVVSAGAVVVQDVPPYAIVAGNPARQLGTRFTPEQIDVHEEKLKRRGTEVV